jgi:hypothetical protein
MWAVNKEKERKNISTKIIKGWPQNINLTLIPNPELLV